MIDRDRTAPEPQPINRTSAGKLLSTARVSWDLTVEDVAHNLNLGVDTIQALEQDDYSRLPGYTFVKGYVRSYAKLLKLDEETVLQAVELEETTTEIPTTRSTTRIRSASRPRKKKSGGGFFKVVFFLIVLAGLVLFAASQLSKLDLREIAVMLKLPVSEESDQTGNDGDEIKFPASEQTDKPKQALIRIEE